MKRVALAAASAAALAACGSSEPPAVTAPESGPRVAVFDAVPGREAELQALRFEVRLDRVLDRDVTIDFIVEGGSASAGSDYLLLGGNAVIPAGARRADIAIATAPDDVTPEADEDFFVRLVSAAGAAISGGRARGLILDDDRVTDCASRNQLCAGAAEGPLRVPVGVPLGGYLRPPVGGEYAPALEGDVAAFFATFSQFIPEVSEGGGVNVTPPNEARRSPYSTISPSSRGYYDSLMTKALALTSGGRTLVFVKTDTIGSLDELTLGVAARVEELTGIALGDGLVLSATHTHDGPGAVGNSSVKYFWAAIDLYHQDLFDQLIDSIAGVVVKALEARVPARLGYTTGLENTGLNSFRRSRSPYDGEPGRVAEQDALRQRIGLFRVDQVDAAGGVIRPLAMMVNYAAHGIVFDVENLYFSGDALGGLERGTEARFDTPVVVMQVQSAGGDVSPRADGDPRRQRVERFGERAAPQVLDLWNRVGNFRSDPVLEVLSQRVILNRERLGYTGTEYPYEYGAVQCNADQPGSGNCIPAIPNGVDDEADNGVAENDSFVPQDTRLSVLRLGDAVLLTQPGEPLAEQGLRLLEASPFGHDNTFIWGYALDHIGYILPDLKSDWDLGGTEGTTTFWGWKQGGRLLRASSELMQALRNGTAPPADEFAIQYRSGTATAKTPTLSPMPGQVLTQPQSLARFETTRFVFEGGDPVLDLPTVRLEEEVAGEWQPMRRRNGRVLDHFHEYWLDYAVTNGGHGWTVRFEPAKDFPAGRYRFHVSGQAQRVPGAGSYEALSDPFEVRAASNLQLGSLSVNGDIAEAVLAYAPVPANYRLVDADVPTDQAAPVRRGAVRFSRGGEEAVDASPDIELREERLVAVYRARLGGSGELTAAGEDIWGNHSP